MYPLQGLALSFLAFGLIGCAIPSVKYEIFKEGGERKDIADISDTYMLAKTQLMIMATPVGTGADRSVVVSVALRKIEDPTRSFGITPWDRWYGVKTRVSMLKFDNTPLVKTISVAVEDKRKEFVVSAFKLLGTVAKLSVGVAAQAAPGSVITKNTDVDRSFLRLPVVIDTLSELGDLKCGKKDSAGVCSRNSSLEGEVLASERYGFSARLSVDKVPPDAIKVEELDSVKLLRDARGVFFSSACRQASLRVSNYPGTAADVILNFSLADPRYVQMVALPTKGTISAHSECGYSVVAEDVVLQSDVDVAESTVSEYIKLKAQLEAQRAAKEKESSVYESGD
ncbi:hypothetical protein [Pseudomonas gingeri]|uniref:Uncharacterized protein n=1 Tax=Pseudomonas gingeri TaxID=117681 RepID=A0A7Y7YBL4_9PSED|nr:hypothetical protein [Pseudomonas gingeri]NWB25553.1 hypothetical protein [Pseudomonas gingeri]NWC33267.1 hypothetical protein [Pseudomonas gingeri]NWE25889.1 hypothetical protein [Pseudomonas gingeri]NWE96255.1 hypothetical protein [Pseudomonas gingeri]